MSWCYSEQNAVGTDVVVETTNDEEVSVDTIDEHEFIKKVITGKTGKMKGKTTH